MKFKVIELLTQLKITLRHTYFFLQFFDGRTLFSLDLCLKGGSNLKALWKSHLTSVRGPISYRIRLMVRGSFFVFLGARAPLGITQVKKKKNTRKIFGNSDNLLSPISTCTLIFDT